ncbi:MAG: hypothetical protein WAM28_07210 [Chlamydiales bacterium]
MSKKNEKRICWNCDGDVPLHRSHCIYCGVDLTQSSSAKEDHSTELGSPFQSVPSKGPFPQSPYSDLFSKEMSVTKEEWDEALDEETSKEEEKTPSSTTRELVAFSLFLPGIVFFLFGLLLLLFSRDGVLTLTWNQSLGLFYFMGATPLLYLGWRALK